MKIKKQKQDVKSMFMCNDCDDCCKHIAVEIDKPTSKADYDNIIWYLLHENVYVFIDHDNDWYVEFHTKCKMLNGNKLCDGYKERPKVCRDYSHEECTKYGDGKPEKKYFKNKEQFIRFLKRKGIDYKFKRQK